MLERVDDRVVCGAGDNDDLVDSGGEKRAREAGDKRPAGGVGEQRLGRSHARRIACGEHDGRQHGCHVLLTIRAKMHDRKHFGHA